MLVIWRSLDFGHADNLMFWAACSLRYFGLLRASEFTVPNLSSFSSSLHLSMQDVAVDSSSAPSSMRIRIKGSKTDPFRMGCFVHIGLGRHPLCAVQASFSPLQLTGKLRYVSCFRSFLCLGVRGAWGFVWVIGGARSPC